MKSDKALIDKINSIIRAYGNVKIDDKAKDIEIETNSVLFDKKKDFIEIENESKTIFNKEYFLYAKELKYNRNEKIITSKLDGKLNDRFENLMKFKEFQLDLKTNILKVKNLTINDTDKNTFKLVEAAINLNSKEIIGNNAKLF